MPYKPFHREEYPLDILSEFGLTEEMIYDLPDYVHERLESGLKSPLLPISIRQPFGLTHCYAKFCLTETEDGIDVLFSPKLKEADLSSFTDKERSLLLAGKVIVSDIEETLLSADGEESTQKIKAFVQLDRDTNGVVYSPTQIIGRNLMNINNEFDLTPEDILSFQHSGLVTTTFLDRDERITIGLDLFSENGVVVVAGDASRWEKMVPSDARILLWQRRLLGQQKRRPVLCSRERVHPGHLRCVAPSGPTLWSRHRRAA